VLDQFGYGLDLESDKELLSMIRVFALQQAAHHEAPLLVIENTHLLRPAALGAVCKLADLRINTGSALKIFLVSDRSLQPIIMAPAMQSIARRMTYDFHISPMTKPETRDYLHHKLRAAGSVIPEYVFTEAVCDELWTASGGWPGILDRLALLALARADSLPVSEKDIEQARLPRATWNDDELALVEALPTGETASPRLIVSIDGKVVEDMQMNSVRLLVGRSDHNDIMIENDFISRHHALLVRHGQSTFLMDLNSTNGTFVNGKRVSNHVLVDNDIISLGTHRIKFSDSGARKGGTLHGAEFAETAIMRTLEDMRSLLARENTELLPAAAEEVLKGTK
jgi:pSer/pThr/pTyr-binding forkhead associated (FHA) protein